MRILREVWWDRRCLTDFWSGVFPLTGCILGADTETTRRYASWDVPSWDKALPRAVSTLAQLNSTAVWSAAVKWFEIYLLHFFFLPRTEEVNRHLKRDSPGLIVQQFLARHVQWKTLDSGVLFQGSPEWVHWPVGHGQAFTWRRNGKVGFVLELHTEKGEKHCEVVIWWTLCIDSVLSTYYTWNGNWMIGNTSCILTPHLHCLVCFEPTVFKDGINLLFPVFLCLCYYHP